MMRVEIVVYEGENVVYKGYKYIKDGASDNDLLRLIEHEAALAHYFRRMTKDPLLLLPVVDKRQDKDTGRLVVYGYYD